MIKFTYQISKQAKHWICLKLDLMRLRGKDESPSPLDGCLAHLK